MTLRGEFGDSSPVSLRLRSPRRTRGSRRRRRRPRRRRATRAAVGALRAAEAVRRHGVDEDQRRDEVGAVEQQLHDHAAAHAPADEVRGPDVERVEQRDEVVGEVAQAARGVDRLGLALAEAAQVGRDAAEALGQVRAASPARTATS